MPQRRHHWRLEEPCQPFIFCLLRLVGSVFTVVVVYYFIIYPIPLRAAGPTYVPVAFSINQPTIWSKDNSPYIVNGWGNLEISSDLIIEPGVVVKFLPDRYNWRFNGLKIIGQGRLLAQGTDSDPVIFSSWFDDTAGGDTNLDQNLSQPLPGDWNGLYFEGINSQLSNVKIAYAGMGGYAVQVQSGSNVILSNVDIASSSGSGLLIQQNSAPSLTGLDIHDNNSVGVESYLAGLPGITVKNSKIRNNKGGALRLVADNSVLFDNVDFIDNQPQRVEIISNVINYDATWHYIPGLTYVSFLPGRHWVKPGTTLTIEAGVNVKFNQGAGLYVQGNIKVAGTTDLPIILTSLKNNEVGAGSVPEAVGQPVAGDWGGIYLDNAGSVNLENLVISYGGDFHDLFNGIYYNFFSDSLIKFVNSSGSLNRVVLLQSANTGLFLDGASSVNIQNSSFQDMPHGVESEGNKSVVIAYTIFSDFTDYAVKAGQGSSPIDARYNWWGNVAGPVIADNAGGKGEKILGNVLYSPWLLCPDISCGLSEQETPLEPPDQEPTAPEESPVEPPIPNPTPEESPVVNPVDEQPVNNPPRLVFYSNEAGYETDGVEPNIGFRDLNSLSFKILYQDADNTLPVLLTW